MTKLEKIMKREIIVNGEPCVLTIGPDGIKLTKKGCRIGPNMTWTQFCDQEAPTIS